MNLLQRILHRPFFIRLLHWEYWSFGMIYGWILPYWFYLCLKARSFFFFSASNPTIENGGFADESKEDIYPMIPRCLTPLSYFFRVPAGFDEVYDTILKNGLSFPMVAKPNKGGKGKGVKIIRDEKDLRIYIDNAIMDFHVQEYVPFDKEAGIFYYRYPGEDRGRISGIVRKEFLKVTGDGERSLLELVNLNKRAILQIDSIRKNYGKDLSRVLAKGEEFMLVPYGNHARGAMFIDDTHLVEPQIENVIDETCKKIKGFYFGRLDIRYNDWEELRQGKNFSIIEVNGAGSEPTHIYDPSHSIFFAWKELTRHWNIMYKISRINHANGHPYLNWKQGTHMFRQDKINVKMLEGMTD